MRNEKRPVRFSTVMAITVCCAGAALGGSANDLVRRVRYGFTLRNPRAELVPAARFWVYAPASLTGIQAAGTLSVSHPHRILKDELGNRIVSIVFTNLPPFGVKVVTVDATVVPATGTPATEGVASDLWLRAEPLLEFESDAFKKLAPRFDAGDPLAASRRIFDWVRAHVKDRGYVRRDRGALYALTHGEGDCTESALLFTALCRRQGIPARTLGGYVVDRDRVLASNAYHNWAEFHADGRWRLTDVQENIFDKVDTRYLALRIVGPPPEPMKGFARFRYEPSWLDVRMN